MYSLELRLHIPVSETVSFADAITKLARVDVPTVEGDPPPLSTVGTSTWINPGSCGRAYPPSPTSPLPPTPFPPTPFPPTPLPWVRFRVWAQTGLGVELDVWEGWVDTSPES